MRDFTPEEKEVYNNALDNVLKQAKGYGLISTEEGFCILRKFIDKEIDELDMWEMIDDMAHNELSMAVECLRKKE